MDLIGDNCLKAHRDPAHVPPPLILLSFPSHRVVLLTKLEDPSQLKVEARKLIANTMQTTFTSAHVALQGER